MASRFKKFIPKSLKRIYRQLTGRNAMFEESGMSVFNRIFETNYWRSDSSVSGPGSSLEQTATVRQLLPGLFAKYQIRTVLDIPCGDFFWMKQTDLSGVSYTGADVVKEVVDRNSKAFGSATVTFTQLDLTKDKLPKVDLIICRDCLVHFSYDHIRQAVSSIKGSGSKYLLTTSFVNRPGNRDIATGKWRPLNLLAEPFCFNEPVDRIHENCTEGGGTFADKELLLFDVSKL